MGTEHCHCFGYGEIAKFLPENLSLFPEPEPETKSILAPRLRLLARQNILIGTSSWKYPGWLGAIYSPGRYPNQKRFEAECLGEYAETFPIVCGDFAYYQFPSPQFWQKLFAPLPQSFLFAFKAPEEITRPRFPGHPRYGSRAGLANPLFLDVEMLKSQFLELLLPYAERIPLIIFEFGAIPRTIFAGVEEFVAALNPFLSALPQTFRYAVEVRNPDFFDRCYFEALANHGVAHVFNAWTRMPELKDQIAIADAFTSSFTVTRALLTPGRSYEEAVQTFSPYTSVREPNQAVRDALRQVLVRAKQRAEPTYIFVNNRLEGFAPGTILAVTED
jgi:uncharacterized protein YecE (DUF72 family)